MEEMLKCDSCGWIGDYSDRKENRHGDILCPECGEMAYSYPDEKIKPMEKELESLRREFNERIDKILANAVESPKYDCKGLEVQHTFDANYLLNGVLWSANGLEHFRDLLSSGFSVNDINKILEGK